MSGVGHQNLRQLAGAQGHGSSEPWSQPWALYTSRKNDGNLEKRHSMVRTEHRLEAYATLVSGLSRDLPEPSRELLPCTRSGARRRRNVA